MTRYLISFDDGAMTFPEEELPDVAKAAHDVVQEAKGAGVWVSEAGASSFGADFNYDYQVSMTPQEKASGRVFYNYETIEDFPSEERPGASVFYKNPAGEIFHTYSTYGRGLDILIGA